MGLKKISSLLLVILMISISLEAGVSSSIGLQNDVDLKEEQSNDLADSAWPKYRGCKRNTGRSPYDASHVDGRVEWDLRGYAWTRAEPVIGPNGTIYVSYGTLGDNQGTLSAVNPNGTEMWNFHRGRWIRSTPAIASDGSLYLGINDRKQIGESRFRHIGTFYGVNQNGTEKWNYSVDDPIYYSPTIGEDGTIYVSIGEELYAFSQDGTVKWNHTFEENLYSSPAIGTDGTIYVGAWDTDNDWEGYLYAINLDGTKEWSYHTENGGLNKNKDFNLFIVDGFTTFYRPLYNACEEERISSRLGRLLIELMRVARKKDMPVVITTQVYESDNGKKPVGGHVLYHNAKTIVLLEVLKSNIRKAVLEKHRSQARGKSARFKITEDGIVTA